MSPSASAPEFFVDRSLGRHQLADALRDLGVDVRTMAAVYGEKMGQGLADETWLADAGRRGLVVLIRTTASATDRPRWAL